HDLGNLDLWCPRDLVVTYSQHYCTKCRKSFHAVVSLYPAGNAVASKSGKILPFHNRVRGFCHGITPLFLPAHGPGAPLALRHAALGRPNRVTGGVSEPTKPSAAAVQPSQRPQPVPWPPPKPLLCRL